uniref:GDSL esterase/lipase n=1 Tax=Oryza nivara TaxID=4536 RepID=A0A0E0IXP4_ORYNI
MALLPLLLLLLLRIVASAPASLPATALFVLGDSTASCAATTLPINLSLTSSSGNCLFPSAHRLLPDLLAAKMGLPPRLEAPTPQDADAAAARAVFILSFGTDAYARVLSRRSEADASAPKHGRRGLARLLADRVARAVEELYEAGARRTAVMGVAPLGCAPRVMWEGLHVVDGRSCVEEANELVQGYNARVAARLAALRPRLPGADITRKACCGLGPFGGTVGCLTKEMVCPTPQRHVWWDLYSPTEVVTSLLANWSWSAPSHSNATICRPITLEMLTGHMSSMSPSKS